MKDIIILGAGASGQEIALLIEEINTHSKEWNLKGYLDSHPWAEGKTLLGYPVLGGFHNYIEYVENCYFVVSFGDSRYRKKVVEKVNSKKTKWATLISPTVRIHPSNKIGVGCVIGRLTDLTFDCVIGNHVLLNIHLVLGHDVHVGDYSVISPNVTVNGGAKIGSVCSIGANVFIRDVTVSNRVVVGASSCVVNDVPENVVIAGNPAKIIKNGPPDHSFTKL